MAKRNCQNCQNKEYCTRTRQWSERGCRLFKPRDSGPRSTLPECSRTSCKGNTGQRCIILKNNDFGGRECPFYRGRDEG